MSAFIVDPSLINGILTFVSSDRDEVKVYKDETELSFKSEKDLQQMAQILMDENYRSVNFRYRSQDKPVAIEFKSKYTLKNGGRITSLEVLKACDCFDYQACETDDYTNTLAWKIIDTIRGNAIRRLSGYDKIDCWGDL